MRRERRKSATGEKEGVKKKKSPLTPSTRKCLSPTHCSPRRMWKQARQRRLAGRSWRTTAPCVLSDSQPRTFPRLSVRLCSCPAPFLKLPSVWSFCFLFHFLLLPSFPSHPPSLAFSPSLTWSLWPVAASAPFSVLTLFYWRLSSFTCSCNMCNIPCREWNRREECWRVLLFCFAFQLMGWNQSSLWF